MNLLQKCVGKFLSTLRSNHYIYYSLGMFLYLFLFLYKSASLLSKRQSCCKTIDTCIYDSMNILTVLIELFFIISSPDILQKSAFDF